MHLPRRSLLTTTIALGLIGSLGSARFATS